MTPAPASRRTRRICPRPGCPNPITRPGACTDCRAADRRARGTTTEQGYGWEHQQIKARLLRTTPRDTTCPRCPLPLFNGEPIDLDHSDTLAANPQSQADRLCHARCNRAAGGRLAHGNH